MQIEVPDFWLFTIFILIEQLHMLYAFIIQFHNYRFRAVFAVVDECVPLLFPVRKAGSVIPDDHILQFFQGTFLPRLVTDMLPARNFLHYQ